MKEEGRKEKDNKEKKEGERMIMHLVNINLWSVLFPFFHQSGSEMCLWRNTCMINEYTPNFSSHESPPSFLNHLTF